MGLGLGLGLGLVLVGQEELCDKRLRPVLEGSKGVVRGLARVRIGDRDRDRVRVRG